MAVLDNGYVDDAVAYAYAKARFPNNFILPSPDNVFRGSMYNAGDIINSNDEKFIGVAETDNTGDRAWPRVRAPDAATTQYDHFFNGEVPEDIKNAYQWLAIAIALSPELFGTSSSSSSDVVTTGGGITGFDYDNIRVQYAVPSSRTIERTAAATHPLQTLQPFYHFQQALNYLDKFLLPGEEIELPGIEHIVRATRNAVEQPYAEMAQFNVLRA